MRSRDRQRVEALVALSQAPNTTRAYRSRFRDFERWCRELDFDSRELIRSGKADEAVSAYFAQRDAEGVAVTTLKLAQAALRAAADPVGRLSETVLGGCARKHASREIPQAPGCAWPPG